MSTNPSWAAEIKGVLLSNPIRRLDIGAALERNLEHCEVIVDGGDRQRIKTIVVARIRIGAQPQERLRGSVLAAESSHNERRAALGILQVRLFAIGDQLLDRAGIAVGRGCMQPGIDTQLTFARRRLRRERARGDVRAKPAPLQ